MEQKKENTRMELEKKLEQKKDINIQENKTEITDMIKMVRYLCIVIVIMVCMHCFVVQKVVVNGSSMEKTLTNQDYLLVEKLSYQFGNPDRYDIIVFQPYEKNKNLHYVKRVIGLPGETIQIIDGTIYINDVLLNESYGNETIKNAGIANKPILLKENEYFVLGDNRNNSKDSRSLEVGMVKKKQITGKAFVCIWPFEHMSVLKHQKEKG